MSKITSKRLAAHVERSLVDSPLPLALLRIVVPLVIVCSPELHDAQRLTGSPGLLTYSPEGLHFVSKLLPESAAAVRTLQVIAFSSAATAMLGWASRASMLVLTISAGLVFTLSQRQGAVVHDMHLLWMCTLLAASPCGDAWSLDAWGKKRPLPSLRYGVPLMTARVLLGLVYFFPGLHKLRVSGLAWMSSANVLGHMQAKWLEHGAVPFLRIDRAPLLCAVGAAFVILFELSFLFLAIPKRTRLVAVVTGLVFHFSTQLFFFITFTSLWACYAVLLDAKWLERLERRLHTPTPEDARPPGAREVDAASVLVGCMLVAIVAVQGARGMTQAWPFACYPTFSHVQGDTIPDIAVEVTTKQGETLRLTGRERAPRSQAEWGRVFRLSGAYGEPIDHVAVEAYARRIIAGVEVEPASSIRVYRVDVPTAPERWNEAPRGGVLLTELAGPRP